MGWPRPQPISLALLAVAAVLLPFVVPDSSWIGIATLGLIWMTLNQSWNLVLGFAGVWNFGQLAIYAVGGYVAALLSLHTSLPPLLSLLIGGVAAALLSLLIAIPALRLRGIYVSLLTFGFAEVVRLLIISDQSNVTGGSYGLSGFSGFGLEALDSLTRQRMFYWIALGVVVITAVAIYLVIRSPLGSGLIALRDNPALAAARGINPRTYQLVVFGISGFFAGIAGGLYAFVFGVISPTLMGLGPMTLLVTMLVVGGLGTLIGPIVGTIVITFIQARLQEWPDIRLLILGLILLVMVLAMPRGLVPVFSKLSRRLKDWIAAGDR
nr:branched-chain amino acid ABC transporter permease [Leifsonia psychrotolerans]